MAMRTRDTQSHDFKSLKQGKDTKNTTDKSKKTHHKKSDAVKALELRKGESIKYKYPNFRFPPKPKYSDATTNGLIKCILVFLDLNGAVAERFNSQGRIHDKRKKSIDVLGNIRTIGSTSFIPTQHKKADIIAKVGDRNILITVKKIASESELICQKKIKNCSEIHLVIYRFQGFYDWFNTEYHGKK